MPLLKRKRVLAAKVETTPGTAVSLTGSDGSFNAYDIMIQPEIDVDSREGNGGFGMLTSIVGAYKGKATFKTDLGWDGTSTVPTWASVLLPAVGFVNSTGVFYPKTEAPGSNVKTLTIGCYLDGVFKSICGAVGNVKFTFPTGKMAFAEWEFTGVWVTPSDVSVISPTYPTALPLRYANATTTWNSVALCLSSIGLDFGNEIIMRECAAGNGYEAGMIANRNPKVTGDPEARTVASQDRYGNFLSMTEGALTWNLDGPTNSTITFAAPKAQIVKIIEADRSKLVTDQIEWQLNKNGNTADQELSITFTAAS